MEETQEILRRMGFVNTYQNTWMSDWFGYFILTVDATPRQLVEFIYNRGFKNGKKEVYELLNKE